MRRKGASDGTSDAIEIDRGREIEIEGKKERAGGCKKEDMEMERDKERKRSLERDREN